MSSSHTPATLRWPHQAFRPRPLSRGQFQCWVPAKPNWLRLLSRASPPTAPPTVQVPSTSAWQYPLIPSGLLRSDSSLPGLSPSDPTPGFDSSQGKILATLSHSNHNPTSDSFIPWRNSKAQPRSHPKIQMRSHAHAPRSILTSPLAHPEWTITLHPHIGVPSGGLWPRPSILASPLQAFHLCHSTLVLHLPLNQPSPLWLMMPSWPGLCLSIPHLLPDVAF